MMIPSSQQPQRSLGQQQRYLVLLSVAILVAVRSFQAQSQIGTYDLGREVRASLESLGSKQIVQSEKKTLATAIEPMVFKKSGRPFVDPLGWIVNNEAFSACLIVMDDNHRLSEWIAYHYFAMSLRHLVILPDPRSASSPKTIMDRWRPYMMIEEWNDWEHLPRETWNRTQLVGNSSDPQAAYDAHLARQSTFYGLCAKHFKRLNRTWVTFHDVDEFWVIDSKNVNNTSDRMKQPGSVLNMLKHVRTFAAAKNLRNYRSPCVASYRLQFTAIESSKEQVNKDVPSFLDPVGFETLRWRHLDRRTLIGKSILDVSLVDLDKETWFGLHRIVQWCPSPNTPNGHYLRVNHYLGSWESYNSRPNDPRKIKGGNKNRKIWEKDAYVNSGADDAIRPWIAGFVRYMGEDLSRHLLLDVGVIVNYSALS